MWPRKSRQHLLHELHCLSNTPPLVDVFMNLPETLEEDSLVGIFNSLIQDLWSGRCTSMNPRKFKDALVQHTKKFSGNCEEDAAELLESLLSALGEDLKRNLGSSRMEDLFKSSVQFSTRCPECGAASKHTEPLLTLSLALPIVEEERKFEVVFAPASHTRPWVQYTVTCQEGGTTEDLKSELGNCTHVPAGRLTVTNVYKHRFLQIYKDEVLRSILDTDALVVFEGPDPADDQVLVPVYMREKSDVGVSLFGKPLLLSLPAEVSHGDLYKVILERKSRFVRQTARQEEGNIKQKEDKSGDELCLQLQEDDSSDEMESRLFTISLVDKYGHSRTQASQEDTIAEIQASIWPLTGPKLDGSSTLKSVQKSSRW